jgi:hypothetical protein
MILDFGQLSGKHLNWRVFQRNYEGIGIAGIYFELKYGLMLGSLGTTQLNINVRSGPSYSSGIIG